MTGANSRGTAVHPPGIALSARRSILTALVCCAAAWTPLTVLVPTGEMPALAPSAGFAAAFVLVWGAPAAWGVFAGMGLAAAMSAGFAVLPALLLAGGAVAQALAGASLARRRSGWPDPLVDVRSAQRFLWWIGPVPAVVGTTAGAAATIAAAPMGSLSITHIAVHGAFGWLSQALGILLGVLLLLPLLMRHSALWQRRVLAISLPVGTGLLLLVVLLAHATANDQARQRGRLALAVEPLVGAVDLRLNAYRGAVSAVASLFHTRDPVTRTEFQHFVAPGIAQLTGLHAIGWLPRVSGPERERLEQQARAEGLVRFSLRERRADGRLVAATRRPEYVVPLYVEPTRADRTELGLDLLSDPLRRRGLETARTRGEHVAVVTLPAGEGRTTPALLLLVPVRDTVSRAVKGYVAGVFRVVEGVAPMLEELAPAGLLLSIQDASHRVLYRSPGVDTREAGSQVTIQRTFSFGAQQLHVDAFATHAFIAAGRTWQPLWLLVAGVLFLSTSAVLAS